MASSAITDNLARVADETDIFALAIYRVDSVLVLSVLDLREGRGGKVGMEVVFRRAEALGERGGIGFWVIKISVFAVAPDEAGIFADEDVAAHGGDLRVEGLVALPRLVLGGLGDDMLAHCDGGVLGDLLAAGEDFFRDVLREKFAVQSAALAELVDQREAVVVSREALDPESEEFLLDSFHLGLDGLGLFTKGDVAVCDIHWVSPVS